MTLHELAPGLSYWLAPHPEWEPGENWPERVPSFRFESPDGLVYVDPLAPPDEPPAWVLLTSPWHARDTARIVERQPGVKVWAPPRAHWKGASLASTKELPAGVEVLLPDGDPNEALFFLPEQRALITGDLFSGTGGRFHLFLDDQDRDSLFAWLPRSTSCRSTSC